MAIAKSTEGVAEARDGRLTTVEWAVYSVVAVGLAGLGYWVTYSIIFDECFTSPDQCRQYLFKAGSDYGALAGIFVLTLAVERAIEPLSRYFGPSSSAAKEKRDKALAESDVAKAAQAQADVDRARQGSVLVAWGIATGLAFVLCGALHVLLLSAIAADGSPSATPWADLLVTGLVVGAGTKSVHDVISRIQKAKTNGEDPKETKAGTGV